MSYVLIVEPAHARIADYQRVVTAVSLDPVIVPTTEAALKMLANLGPPAAVVSDPVLPRSDGFEFLRQLRGLAPTAPVLLVSAFDEMLDLAWTLREPLGVSQVLRADASAEQLTRALERALSGIPGEPPKIDPRRAARERERLERIDALGLVQEGSVDDELQKLVADAAAAFDVPVALVSLVLEDKQWFKAHFGLAGKLLEDRSTPRDWAFCKHVVASERPLVVHDAAAHPMFSDNPLVRDGIVRGYAGAPLLTADGYALGTVCLIDQDPINFSAEELDALTAMARRVAAAIHLRYGTRRSAGLDQALAAERERGEQFPALAYLDAILGNIPIGIMLLGHDERIAFVNAELGVMAGLPVDEILQMSRQQWIRHNIGQFDDPKPFLRMVRGLPPGPFLAREQFEVQRPRRRVLRWSALPVQLPAGVGQLFAYFDVTDAVDASARRDELAAAVERSEATLRSIFDAVPVGILTRDVRGTLISTNQSIRDMLGYSEAELRQLDGKALDPEQDQASDDLLRSELVSGQRRTVTRTSRYQRKDGGWLNARLTASLVRSLDGQPQFTVTVVEDQGKTQQLEAELARSEVLYRALAQNMPYGALFMFDRDLRYVAVEGEAVLRKVGLDRELMLGRTMPEFASPENRDAAIAIYHSVFAGESRSREFSRGEHCFVMHTSPVLGSDGGVIAGTAAIYDITAQKRVEEQLRRQTSFSQLLAASAIAANESPNSLAAIGLGVDLVCRHTGWPLGHAFVPVRGSLFYGPTQRWNFDADRERFGAFIEATATSRITPGRGFLSKVLDDGKPRWLLDLPNQKTFLRREAAAACGLRSGLAFPVFVGQEVVALLEFYSDQPVEPDAQLLEVMGHVGVQLGRAVERERDREKLRELSLNDELTGLYNRRGFLTLARQQLAQSRRERRNLLLLFVDLDGMKQINDKLGHDAGDRALVATARILKRSFRGADIVARLGGDEFVILAHGVGRSDEKALRDRLEKALELHNAEPGVEFQLRMSLGTMESDHQQLQTIEDLLADADRMMYVQKSERKRRASQT